MSNKNSIVTGQIVSTIATGTAPMSFLSTTNVSNLKPELSTSTDGINFSTSTWVTTAGAAPIKNSILQGSSDTACSWVQQLWGPAMTTSSTVNTSAGSTNLNVGGTKTYHITGSTASFVINLPTGAATNGYSAMHYIIINQSTQTITVKAADTNTLVSIATLKSYHLVCHTTNSDAVGSWNAIGPMNV